MLFASDDDLRNEQRRAVANRKDQVSPAEARREAIEDARELRAHARARQFAYLLFVAPVLMAIAVAVAELVVAVLRK